MEYNPSKKVMQLQTARRQFIKHERTPKIWRETINSKINAKLTKVTDQSNKKIAKIL